MISQTLRVAIIAAVIAIATPVVAQDCGCGVSSPYVGNGLAGNNCGRDITQQQALGLWAGYCSESCGYGGGSSCGGGLAGGRGGCKLGNRHSRRGGGVSACGCDTGNCFSYPSNFGGCGAYTDVSSGCGCRSGGKLRNLHGHSSRGGCRLRGERGGCGVGSSNDFGSFDACGSSSACGSSNGCGGRLKGLLAKCKLFQGGCSLFSRSRQSCGCSGSYFSEAVGYEYGTAGIQSCVAGTVGTAMAPAMNFSPAIEPSVAPQATMHNVQPQVQGNMIAPANANTHTGTIQTFDGGH